MTEGGDRSTERVDPADHYATAARAVAVMGVYDARTVQKWMAKAGVEAWGNYGYPIADLVRVINSRRWPGKRELRAEHFRVRIVRPDHTDHSTERADSPDPAPPAATQALVLVPPLLAALAALGDRSTALAEGAERLAAEQAALAAALAQEQAERSTEQREMAERLDALAAEVAALTARRKPWWRRWLGRE